MGNNFYTFKKSSSQMYDWLIGKDVKNKTIKVVTIIFIILKQVKICQYSEMLLYLMSSIDFKSIKVCWQTNATKLCYMNLPNMKDFSWKKLICKIYIFTIV